jgi:hypothetical protein
MKDFSLVISAEEATDMGDASSSADTLIIIANNNAV